MSTPLERAEKVFESRGIEGIQAVKIDRIKKAAAELYSIIDSMSVPPGNTEAGRLLSLAKTDIELSVMWAVKAVSRGAM